MRWVFLITLCILLFLAAACREKKKPTKTPTPKTGTSAVIIQLERDLTSQSS